jgi:hypothetical protein
MTNVAQARVNEKSFLQYVFYTQNIFRTCFARAKKRIKCKDNLPTRKTQRKSTPSVFFIFFEDYHHKFHDLSIFETYFNKTHHAPY